MQALDSPSLKLIPFDMVYVFLAVLAGLLVALSIADLKTFRLPNVLTYTLIGTGLLQALIMFGRKMDNIWSGLPNHLIGAVAGYLIFVIIEVTFKKVRGVDGLGRGDAKLLAGGGAWCGWMALPFIVFIGSFMGLVAALFPSIRKQGRIPFGPFLALGIISVWIAQNIERLWA